MSTPYSENIDLTNCDREPIHILGHVQSFGCLIAVSSDWLIRQASVNVSDHLGLQADELIGSPLNRYLTAECINTVRTRLQLVSKGDDTVDRVFGLTVLPDDPRRFDVTLYRSGQSIVLEFQPENENGPSDQLSVVRPMVDRIQAERDIPSLCQTASRHVRALTGFDRVMVYKFHPDDSGEVIAESVVAGKEPFLGLRYPSTDIPKQARELYRRNFLRIISDVDDRVAPIIPEMPVDRGPLDLSLSTIRAVSPIHLEYLRNMGVKASLSISILKRGKLWGLFACHHDSPKILGFNVRAAAELFAQMFSFVLEQVESDTEQIEATKARVLHDQLMGQLAEGEGLWENFEMIADALKSVINCDGVAIWAENQFKKTGFTPSEEEFRGLARHLNTQPTSQIYATENIAESYPAAEQFQDRAAGLLALPISRNPRDYIVLFRREIRKEVSWAGNPEKPVTLGPNGARLTPRKSFETWKQVVEGTSQTWSPGEISAAESLRITLLEVVLRISDAASRDRLQSQERQDLLIAELNHRVRNILNLIRGLVSQSRSEARTVSEFTNIVGGRIHALGRAHDQLTQENWEPASLRELIQTEVEAYLGEKADRVSISGPEVLVEPAAFTTMALVLHELTTNSAKYGSLSDSGGLISIVLEEGADGALHLHWRESGGPPVKAPTRRGFGSTVIERSIPYELKGDARIRYELTGFEADFMIPARVVTFSDAVITGQVSGSFGAQASDDAGVTEDYSGRALVLEDNMIIALDAEDLLREVGFTDVLTVSTVDEALSQLDNSEFQFALLDVNLGHETSERAAQKVVELGLPFAFATGYGDAAALTRKFNDPVVLQKPFDMESLKGALRDSFSRVST